MSLLPARVLFDLPNWLGDFVHTLPALARVQEANRGGESIALLPAAYAPLARWLGVNTLPRPRKAGFVWARHELRGRFDVAITARHSTRAKLVLAAAAAPLGLASAGRGAAVLGLSTFAVARTRHQRHDLDAALAVMGVPGVDERWPAMQLPVPLRAAGARRRAQLSDGDGLVVLLPGSRRNGEKRFPAEIFAALAGVLRGRGHAVVVVAGPGEEEVAARVAVGGARAEPTGQALDETAALFAACDVAVGNDSGLTHLAAAVGCPTVALFGPTDPGRTAPTGPGRVVRASGGGNGAAQGALELVVRATEDLLGWSKGLQAGAVDGIMTQAGGPLAQLAEQGTLNP
jgi:heptosyltransferase-2